MCGVGEGLRREKWRKRVEFSAAFFVPWATEVWGAGDREVCRLCLLAGVEKVGKSLRVCWQCAFRRL